MPGGLSEKEFVKLGLLRDPHVSSEIESTQSAVEHPNEIIYDADTQKHLDDFQAAHKGHELTLRRIGRLEEPTQSDPSQE